MLIAKKLEFRGYHQLLSMDTTSGNVITLGHLENDENGQSQLDPTNLHQEEGTRGLEFSLPHADSGKDAWLFLAGAFAIEALVWGM